MNNLAKAGIVLALIVSPYVIDLAFHHKPPNPHGGEILWNHGHGDAIQGLYSQRDCGTQPGAHPWFNEVDGHPFFMGCRASESEMAPPVFTQKAPIIIFGKNPGEYLTRLVEVPSHANLVPLVCFLLPTHRAAECFYVSPETGQTAQVTVVLGREST